MTKKKLIKRRKRFLRILIVVLIIVIVHGFLNVPLGAVELEQIVKPELKNIENSAAENAQAEEHIKEKQKIFYVTLTKRGFSNEKIVVNEGDNVRIVLTNLEGVNNLVLKEFSIRTKTLKENEVDAIDFVANNKGVYKFYSDFGRYRGVEGTIIVR